MDSVLTQGSRNLKLPAVLKCTGDLGIPPGFDVSLRQILGLLSMTPGDVLCLVHFLRPSNYGLVSNVVTWLRDCCTFK